MQDEEQWLPAVGFPDYAVSSFGRVKRIKGGKGARFRRILKHQINTHGYPALTLRRDGKTENVSVHVLVAETFLGPAPEGWEVRHRNGDRSNPRLSNLQWGTRADNVEDARKHGTWVNGERNGHAALTEQQAREIKQRAAAGENQRLLGEEFGVTSSAVNSIYRGRTWRHLNVEIGS